MTSGLKAATHTDQALEHMASSEFLLFSFKIKNLWVLRRVLHILRVSRAYPLSPEPRRSALVASSWAE